MFRRSDAVDEVSFIGIDNDRLRAMDDLQMKISENQKKLANTLNSRERKNIINEIDSLYSQKDLLMKKEMDIRDSGIARDILAAIETYSNYERQGLVILGSFHEKGVLRELAQKCKSK